MNGILLVDKEPGWTSNDVVVKLKGMLRQRRIGHSGTLDPMATGLLVVFVGRATRAVEFAECHDKRYIAGLRLGLVTDTQDITGSVLERHEADIDEGSLRQALSSFTGALMQTPPMYSAIKHKGQKLYDIARRGGEVERKPRPVTVSGLSLIGMEDGDHILDISCSKGTYVRTLCHDIGRSLGCGGCMSSLRRVSAGDFRVEDAVKLSRVQELSDLGRAEELLLPVDRLFSTLPGFTADGEMERAIRCGSGFQAELADGSYRVYSQSGEFLMLGAAAGNRVSTVKSFFEV